MALIQNKLTAKDAIAIREAIVNGGNEAELARNYGVTRETIRLVKMNLLHAGVGLDASQYTRERKRDFINGRIHRRLRVGYPIEKIADDLNVSVGSVHSRIRRYFPEFHKPAPDRKITPADAEAIRISYAAGGITQPELAERYGVSRGCIASIVQNRTHKVGNKKR